MNDGFLFQNLALYRMRRLSQAMGKAAEAVLAEDSLIRLHDWRILEMLRQRPGITATQAGPAVLLNKMQVSRAIAHLAGHGLVDVGSSPVDGRAAPLTLTARGRQVLAEVRPRMAALEMWALAELTPAELAQLDALLGKVERRLAGTPAPDAAALDRLGADAAARRRSAYLYVAGAAPAALGMGAGDAVRADAYEAPKP